MLWLLLACADPPQEPEVPTAHSWQEEAELVSAGLADVRRLWLQDNRAAAAALAERVYTERWEPRLEPVARKLDGDVAVMEIEYRFGQLVADLQSNRPAAKVEERFRDLDTRVRKVADTAARAYPPPAQVGAPPPPPEGSKPVTPEATPNWEKGE